jgi:hypothetical protein
VVSEREVWREMPCPQTFEFLLPYSFFLPSPSCCLRRAAGGEIPVTTGVPKRRRSVAQPRSGKAGVTAEGPRRPRGPRREAIVSHSVVSKQAKRVFSVSTSAVD